MTFKAGTVPIWKKSSSQKIRLMGILCRGGVTLLGAGIRTLVRIILLAAIGIRIRMMMMIQMRMMNKAMT